MLRSGRYEEAGVSLEESALPPFSNFFLAISLARSGDTERAESVVKEAEETAIVLRDRESELPSPPSFLHPDWPLDGDVVLVLEKEVEDILKKAPPYQ